MKKDSLIRTFMLAAGFLAVVGILCSRSFYSQGSGGAKAKAATEQSSDKKIDATIVPGDAIPGHATQLDDSSAFHVITTIFEVEEDTELPPVLQQRVGQLFEVLFQTLIAP